MQFNPNDNPEESIVLSMRELAGGASATDLPLAKAARLANLASDMMTGWAIEADDRMEFDDPNWPNQPVLRLNLVSGQRDYLIYKDENDAHVLKVLRVAVKDRNGVFKVIDPTDIRMTTGVNLAENTQSGTPTKYDKTGVWLNLDPVPDYSSSQGLRVYIQRAAKRFSATDTTKEPGFASSFHFLVPLIGAYIYATEKGSNVKSDRKFDLYGADGKSGAKADFQAFYTTRSLDETTELGGFTHDPE